MNIEFTSTPQSSEIDFLTQKINQETSFGSAYPFAFFIRNQAGEIIAGCNGSVVFGSIYTDQLWVHPNHRRSGLGLKLMNQVHDYGNQLGCKIATVSTMSFQSGCKFYEKLGYVVDFERNGYVKGSSCLFLRKELMNLKTKQIEVVTYNSVWPQLFEIEAAKIKEVLGYNYIAIHHIGSTSVPGLIAKEDIDILCVVDNLLPTTILEKIGYVFKGEFNIPLRYFFSKNSAQSKVNLHVYENSHPEIELNLLFRDYLRLNSKVRDEYALLKLNLLSDKSSFEKDNSPFTNYTLRKGDFIRKTLKEAEFKTLRILKCTDKTEWDTAKHFRQKYFFDKLKITDPYIWTFNHLQHEHLVLYQGTEIIGYAHIQLWPHARAAMRIIVIDSSKRNNKFGSKFLSLCEKWLKSKAYDSLHIESSPEALEFYQRNGYVKMRFDDPDDYPSDPSDIPLGKIL